MGRKRESLEERKQVQNRNRTQSRKGNRQRDKKSNTEKGGEKMKDYKDTIATEIRLKKKQYSTYRCTT